MKILSDDEVDRILNELFTELRKRVVLYNRIGETVVLNGVIRFNQGAVTQRYIRTEGQTPVGKK